MKDLLFKTAKDFNILLDEGQLELFYQYYNLLAEWNKKFNLTTLTGAEDVILKHFVDSLTAAKFIPKDAKIADIGSGAGFPGIPLKIYRPDIEITLIDSLNKRVLFLQEVCAKLNLSQINCLHIRAEDAGKDLLRNTFDAACCRAVSKLNILCEYALPLLKIGGIFIAYKAKDDGEIEQAKSAIKILGGQIETIYDFNLYELSRKLIIIKKINQTPKTYPRAFGKIQSSPL